MLPPYFLHRVSDSFAAMAALSATPCFFPLPLLCFFLFVLGIYQTPLSFAADTISANQSLSASLNLTSKGGNFNLGFFRPPNGTSNAYYVGIWYNTISLFTSVWEANRETPITDPTTSELKIGDDGNLVLLNQSKSIVWSTHANISSKSTVAVILDSGNLQLRDEFNSSRVFWQSLDHPTSTWLPGGKLGLNKVTKQSQHLIAWKNKADPAPGIFSLALDPDGTTQYYIFWNMTKRYWTSGVWDANARIFDSVPEMNLNYNYDFTFVTSAEEAYFTYSVKYQNVISRLVVDSESGQIQQQTWNENLRNWMLFWSQPKSKCSVYALCGPFGSCNDFTTPFCSCVQGFRAKSQTDWDLGDRTGGCVRNTPLQCNQSSSIDSKKDGFFPMSGVKLPDNPQTFASGGSAENCQFACLNNCSCIAYSYNSSGCSVWEGELLNLQEQDGSNPSTLYLRLAATELQSITSKKKVATPAIVGIVVGTVAACFAIIWILICRSRSRRMINKAKAVGSSLVPFRYSELQSATKNFSEKLGGGGFGLVFKGYLPNKAPIAVKKLEGLHQGEKQFRAEVSTIGTIQHVNLVRLLGFCSEATKKLLVYEFMPNGSLDTKLFHHNLNVLDWKTRYQIAIGTARGLTYLHEQCRDCIIHCDIKPENILLDASFTPKVADFGLAKLVGRDFSRVLTTMRGTRGYLAPEWITGVPISVKADVYSYGMMLFEIISGRRNLEQKEQGGGGYFPTVAASKLVATGDVQSLLDPLLEGQANLEELERACKLACWCIQDDETCRPTMGQVVQVLEGILQINNPPVPRSLQLAAEVPEEGIKFFYEFSSNKSSKTRSADSSESETKNTNSSSSGV